MNDYARAPNQPLLTTSSPTFAGLTINGAATFAATVTATGQFLAGNGTSLAPSYAFTNDPDTGFFSSATNALGLAVGGTEGFRFSQGGVVIFDILPITWGSSGITGVNVSLYGDTSGVLSQRNGTAAQESRLYSRYDSATRYHRAAIRSAVATASAVSGASVTLTGLIPDGAVVIGVTSEVATALGTGSGTTGYQVGDGTDPDRWGAITGTAAGTKSDNTNATATTVQMFVAANDVVLTAVGGNFDGTGAIRVTVHYLIAEAAYA